MTEAMDDRVRKFCGDCGKDVAANATSCAACGASLRAVPLPDHDALSTRAADRARDDTRAGGLPIEGRLGLVAILGFFLALVYAFHYIGRSH